MPQSRPARSHPCDSQPGDWRVFDLRGLGPSRVRTLTDRAYVWRAFARRDAVGALLSLVTEHLESLGRGWARHLGMGIDGTSHTFRGERWLVLTDTHERCTFVAPDQQMRRAFRASVEFDPLTPRRAR